MQAVICTVDLHDEAELAGDVLCSHLGEAHLGVGELVAVDCNRCVFPAPLLQTLSTHGPRCRTGHVVHTGPTTLALPSSPGNSGQSSEWTCDSVDQ